MARKKSFRPAIAPVETVDELRKGVENELNRLSTQLGSQDFFADTSANTYRLSRLGNPAAEHDAVNLKTMRKAIDKAVSDLYARLHRPDISKAYRFNDEEFVLVPGGFQILGLDMTKSFNFDTDIFGNEIDFTVLAGGIGTDEIAAGAVTTLKLTTQEINVGYGGNDMPVRFRVWDTNNDPIAWIGDDSINHGGDTDYVGAWFKRLLVGGDGTLENAGMFADANGNVVAKSIWVYGADNNTGWIGERITTGGSPETYQGAWFKQLWVGGTWVDADDTGPNDAPFYVDDSGDLFITDAEITLTDNVGNYININPTFGFNITDTNSNVINMGTSQTEGSGSSVGGFSVTAYNGDTITKFAKVEPERIQCVNAYSSGEPIGVSLESYQGYGDVHVSNSSGTVSLLMHGGYAQQQFLLTAIDTAPPSGGGGVYGALRNYDAGAAGFRPSWYDHDDNTWHNLAYLDEIGGGSSPGGSDGQVQYNDGGSFGGDSGLTFNDSTNGLSITGTCQAADYIIGSTTVINSSGQFSGLGVLMPQYGVAALSFTTYVGPTPHGGDNGTFEDHNGNTIRVRGGIITDLSE